jgi:hypothetical protein
MLQNCCKKYKTTRRCPDSLAFQDYPCVTLIFYQSYETFSSDVIFLGKKSKIDIFCLNYSLQKFFFDFAVHRNLLACLIALLHLSPNTHATWNVSFSCAVTPNNDPRDKIDQLRQMFEIELLAAAAAAAVVRLFFFCINCEGPCSITWILFYVEKTGSPCKVVKYVINNAFKCIGHPNFVYQWEIRKA